MTNDTITEEEHEQLLRRIERCEQVAGDILTQLEIIGGALSLRAREMRDK